jgi:hypothetical protein
MAATRIFEGGYALAVGEILYPNINSCMSVTMLGSHFMLGCHGVAKPTGTQHYFIDLLMYLKTGILENDRRKLIIIGDNNEIWKNYPLPGAGRNMPLSSKIAQFFGWTEFDDDHFVFEDRSKVDVHVFLDGTYKCTPR